MKYNLLVELLNFRAYQVFLFLLYSTFQANILSDRGINRKYEQW